jgi:NarL family two-component system sensor histidine kinase LiaS
VTYIVCGFFGSVLRQAELARDHNQRLVEELQTAQRKVQELAVVEERNRLARELHDSVKQQVFAISMQLSAARASLTEQDRAFAPVVQAEKLAQQAGTELTTLIRELRPPSLERKSLILALKDYIAEWSQQNGISAELDIKNDPSMDESSEQVLFRVVQEALANVARHSRASKVMITLAMENRDVMLTIEDNGIGFDSERILKGVGLDSMTERLAAVAGELTVSSQKAAGTKVTARVRRH